MSQIMLSKAAMFAFALGVLGLFIIQYVWILAPFAIILGFFALTRIPRTRFMRGKRIAVAGILFGGLALVLAMLL